MSDEEKKDDNSFSVTSQQAIKFLSTSDNHEEDTITRTKNLYKSFIYSIFFFLFNYFIRCK